MSALSSPSLGQQLDAIRESSVLKAIAIVKEIAANSSGHAPSDIAETLRNALTIEVRSKHQRRSLIAEIKRSLKRYPETIPAPAPLQKAIAKACSSLLSSVSKSSVSTTEVVAPSWDRARQLLAGIKLYLRISLAGQVMLGAELQQLKRELGFTHGGSRKAGTKDKTWAQHVKDELDLSADTADRMIGSWEAAKAKLKKLGGQPALLAILDAPPSSLTAIQRQTLEAAVAKTTDGETQKSLLEELKLVKVHVNPTLEAQSAGGSAQRRQYSESQMAWDWAGGDIITELNKVRTAPHFKAALMSMPLSKTEEVPFGLIDYVAELRETLAEADAILASRMKS